MTTTRHTAGHGALSHLFAPVADLAASAGARILEIAAKCEAPRTKADKSPVTAADEIAESILIEGLAKIFPGIPVIAEESVSRQEPVSPASTYLLVDPIDGTREMIAGRAEYTVNVALVENHVPVFGVIYAPALEMFYVGGDGAAWRAALAPGARLDRDRLSLIHTRPRSARLVALVSRSHPDPKSEQYLADFPVEKKIPLGSSLKFARLAEGEADLYARLGTVNEWDIAAGHALLAAAGGAVTAPDGGALAYGARGNDFRVNGFVAWGAAPT